MIKTLMNLFDKQLELKKRTQLMMKQFAHLIKLKKLIYKKFNNE